MQIAALGLGVCLACSSPVPREPGHPAKPASAAITSCVDQGSPYNRETLRERVSFLASSKLAGRAPGSDGDRAARAFIVERFRCLGLLGAGPRGAFELPFHSQAQATANVVGYVKGSDPAVGAQIV